MTTFTPMSIGKEIKMARIEKGYTQTQLAELCGWNQKQQSYYENGKHTPTGDKLDKIARLLDKEWKLV